MLPLQRVQVVDGFLQVDDLRQFLPAAVHGLGGEVLPGVVCGHLPGEASRLEDLMDG